MRHRRMIGNEWQIKWNGMEWNEISNDHNPSAKSEYTQVHTVSIHSSIN
jgi:hypothetical protein